MTYSFAEAITALQNGKRVKRYGWIDNSDFIFMQVPSDIPSEIVPKMQSLPQSVKDEFVRRFNDENEQIDAIYYIDQLAIVDKSNVIRGWSPSVTDSTATDWLILD